MDLLAAYDSDSSIEERKPPSKRKRTGDFEAVWGELRAQKAEIDNLKAELQAQKAESQAQKAELQAQKAESQAQKAELQAQKAESQAQIDNLKGETDKLQFEIATVKNILCSVCQRTLLEMLLKDLGAALLNFGNLTESERMTIQEENMTGMNRITLQHWEKVQDVVLPEYGQHPFPMELGGRVIYSSLSEDVHHAVADCVVYSNEASETTKLFRKAVAAKYGNKAEEVNVSQLPERTKRLHYVARQGKFACFK